MRFTETKAIFAETKTTRWSIDLSASFADAGLFADPDDDLGFEAGILSRPTVTLDVHWNPYSTIALGSPLGLKVGDAQEIVYGDGRRLFGIDWWAERVTFDARMVSYSHDKDSHNYGLDFEMISPTRELRAEWWRRWGYAVVKRLPYRSED